jgi:hypothetical protein
LGRAKKKVVTNTLAGVKIYAPAWRNQIEEKLFYDLRKAEWSWKMSRDFKENRKKKVLTDPQALEKIHALAGGNQFGEGLFWVRLSTSLGNLWVNTGISVRNPQVSRSG